MRKQHSPIFKAKIVLQTLRETKPLTQIAASRSERRAAEHEVHPTLLTKWKTEAIGSLPGIFERGASKERSAQEFEKQSAERTVRGAPVATL